MALNIHTVDGIIKAARGLLLDKTKPYRYGDTAMIVGLNLALLETRRLRPDLFVCKYSNEVPQFEEVSGEEVPVEQQFRLGLLYGIAGFVLMRDEEDVQDVRAATFMDNFHDILTGTRPTRVRGGTPTPGQAAAAGQQKGGQ